MKKLLFACILLGAASLLYASHHSDDDDGDDSDDRGFSPISFDLRAGLWYDGIAQQSTGYAFLDQLGLLANFRYGPAADLELKLSRVIGIGADAGLEFQTGQSLDGTVTSTKLDVPVHANITLGKSRGFRVAGFGGLLYSSIIINNSYTTLTRFDLGGRIELPFFFFEVSYAMGPVLTGNFWRAGIGLTIPVIK